MSEMPQDLKPGTKAFALRVTRMYSKLAKNDAVAQVLAGGVFHEKPAVTRERIRQLEQAAVCDTELPNSPALAW